MLRFRRASGFLLFIRPRGRGGVFLHLFAALPLPYVTL
nr:MAG TPA: PHAX RNA-binding domain [Caudoviricetes sp.]